MKPYFWMTDYTPQKEWIDRKGLLLWLAFFLSEVGAGLYIVSLFLEFWVGSLIGWLICALLGGGLHMAYLGKPMRAWRSILRPMTSELSRGIIIMGLFLILGVFQLAPGLKFLSGLPWSMDSLFLKIALSVLAFFVITHGFMTLSFLRAVPFWNSAIMPLLSLASGVWVGAQMANGLSLFSGHVEIVMILEPVARWFLFAYALSTLFYLWNAFHGAQASKVSVKLLLKGELSSTFYTGVVIIGFCIPLIITLYFCQRPIGTATSLIWIRFFCALIGDLALRYCIFKAARYVPIINSNITKGIR